MRPPSLPQPPSRDGDGVQIVERLLRRGIENLIGAQNLQTGSFIDGKRCFHYVGNLSYNTTEESLMQAFAAWGPTSVTLPVDAGS
jgi:hypothetical protein